jgi:hypothetical protein
MRLDLMRRLQPPAIIAGLALTLLALTLTASAAGSRVTPAALYLKLLSSSIPSSQLPSGDYSASTGIESPSSNAKSNHVEGEVEIDIDGGDAAIEYDIFPSKADALADWKDADFSHEQNVTTLPVTGFPKPAEIINASETGDNAFGKKVTNGVSLLAFVVGYVIVEAATRSTTNTRSGDIPGAIALGKLAISHLESVESSG